jgi:hypothetical protein
MLGALRQAGLTSAILLIYIKTRGVALGASVSVKRALRPATVVMGISENGTVR